MNQTSTNSAPANAAKLRKAQKAAVARAKARTATAMAKGARK
ncbi:hypothetical protein [Mesorhizobium muleiense]|nr:hypothetical protein [Mesorhizobium muleiense]